MNGPSPQQAIPARSLAPPREQPVPGPIRPRACAVLLCAWVSATLLASCSGSPAPGTTDPETAVQGSTDHDAAGDDTAGQDTAVGDAAGEDTAGGDAAEQDAAATVLTTSLDAPWSIAFHEGTALVSERDSGRILELTDDGTAREVAIIDGATPRGEGGLLGLAVHQDHLFAYLTTASDNRIVRHPLTGQPGSLGLGPAETILDGLPAADYHNGGRIAVGPDGMLYATVGDAGDRPSAQDLENLGGKILRLTTDGEVPADNPIAGSWVYSYGHRNPQGLAWDADGTLYASEFGQNTWDELNIIEAGGNYGWPDVEGIAGRDGFIDPVQQWSPGDASPSGMAILDGTLHIANLRGQRLRSIPVTDPATSTESLVGEYGRLRDVALAPDGSLWVLTNNTDGRGDPGADDDRILRLQP